MSNQQNGVANCGAYYAVRAGRYSGINYIHRVLNARYAHLEGFVLNIPERFAGIETIIQNYRNDIRVCTVNDSRLVIKSFKGMYFTNQLAYSLFRKSKARRSYENALLLLSRGVNVPAPVAFIDCYRFFFLTKASSFQNISRTPVSTICWRMRGAKQAANVFCGVHLQPASRGNLSQRLQQWQHTVQQRRWAGSLLFG